MSTHAHTAGIDPDEVARRKKVVSRANWSVEMEGLGKQTPEYGVLSELWITGEISRGELQNRRRQMVLDRIQNHD